MARLLLVGGGLANCLLAYRLKLEQPEFNLLLLERGDRLGGNHVWRLHSSDLTADQRAWIAPLVEHSWPGYEVRFPDLRRRLSDSYHTVSSARLHDVLMHSLGEQARLGIAVGSVEPNEIQLEDGTSLQGDAVIDGRGFYEHPSLKIAYQKFAGRILDLETDHGLCEPVLMDATVEQRDGFRFFYTLPFTKRRLLVEDTRYSDSPALDLEEMRFEIERYVEAHGWRARQVAGEEQGVLPIVLTGEIDAYWDARGSGVPRSGMRAALFHPTTGYSFAEAVRLADALARRLPLADFDLYGWIRRRSRRRWREDGFFRLLNRMLFRAARPESRFRVFERFYRLPAPLIRRFYSGRPTLFDRIRILSGKPPVPVGRALKCLRG